MAPELVTDEELFWVIAFREPAATRDVASDLPVAQNSVYVRLRSLSRRGFVHDLNEGDRSENIWGLTDRGRKAVATADLPSASQTDFAAYFAGRSNTLDPDFLLHILFAREGERHRTSVFFDALPFSKSGIRKRLRQMRADGLVACDDSRNTNQWSLTEAGLERLSNAKEVDMESRTYIWHES